jgi:hypothetical protein
LFAYPSDANFDSLGSLEITDYYIDECSQVSKKAVDIVRSRVRFKLNEYNLAPKGLLTCNPSKGWLYNEFFSPWTTGELPPYMAFIQARAIDNPHLPSSYIETLSKLPEVDRKRLLDGDWNFDDSNDAIFNTDDVLRCFRQPDETGELFITADIARLGKDRSVIGLWRGLSLIQVIELRRKRVTEVAEAIKNLANLKYVKLGNIIIDEDGVGGGVCDIVKGTRGFRNGSKASHPERFVNLKAECYFKLAEFIEFGRVIFPSEYKETIVKELDMIRRKNPDGDSKLTVTSKDEIQRMHGLSPDYADMIMMRMFFELFPNYGKYSYV